MNEVSSDAGAVVARPARSVLVAMSEQYGMEPAAFEATLRATVVPEKVSREQFAAFLLVANQYRLNPILKEIYAFPTRSGGIQPIVSVDGWANLINSHPACDGIVFDDQIDDDGQLVAITCRIYRKDREHPTTATEYMVECRRNTDTWRQWPRRMLRHKALIQAARYAFGFSGIVEPDEWERSPENSDAPKPKRAPAALIQGPRKALPPIVGETVAEAEPAPTTEATTEEIDDTKSAAKSAATVSAAEGERAAGAIPPGESPPPASEPDETPVDPLLLKAREKATEGADVFDAWAKKLTDRQAKKLVPHMDELNQRIEAAAKVPA